MRCLLFLSALVVASLAFQPPTFEKPDESDFLTNLHNIIEKEKEFLHNLFGGGQTKTKRNIFGKIGNFFKDHVAEIIKVAEIAGPLVVGKREANDFLTNIHNIIEKEKEFLHNLFGGANSLGKREESDFLTNLHNIIEKEKEFLHNLFGGGQTKTKRNIFGKIGNFFKDHVAEIIKVAEIAGPLVVGKREETDDFLTNLHNIIEKEKEFLHNLFGGGQTKTKRNIFGKIGNFFKDHVAEIIKVAEIAGPLVVGKREANDFLTNIHNIIEKEKEFLHNLFGGVKSLGKRDESDFLTNLHNIIEKEKEFLHNLFGGGQKTKRNIFGKIGNFFKDHVGDIIKVAEIAGPLVIGKREETDDFLTNLHNIIEKEKAFLHNLFGGAADESDLPLFEKPLTHTQIMSLIKQHMV